MGRKLKRVNLWVRRKANLPLLLVAGVIIVLLFINEDTSVSLNMEYEQQINKLKAEIKECEDSAIYYELKRKALITNKEDLERVAREQYNMQRPTEDVYLIK